MKLVTIVGPLRDFDTIINHCIVNKEFHPEPAMSVMKNVKGLLPFDLSNPYAELLRRAEHVADRTGLGLKYHDFTDEELSAEGIAGWLTDFEEEYSRLNKELETLRQRVMESEQVMMQLEHVREVNVSFQDFFSFTFVKFRFGKMPREIYDSFAPHIRDRRDVYFFSTSVEWDTVYGMYMAPRVFADRIDSLFASLQFERIRLSDRIVGTSDEALASLRADIERSKQRAEEIEKELSGFLDAQRDAFHARYSYVRYRNDSFNLRSYAARTEENFYVMGWVPEADYDGFTANLSRYQDVNYVILGEDAEDLPDLSPPIKLKNWKIFRPFEPFVMMYGLPSYNETDPTPMMTITYSLLFGIMFGDLGQGALLILAGYLMWRLKKMWLGRVICYAGASSMLFGLLYGSFFGNEELLPSVLPFTFSVLHNSKGILQYTIYGGAGLITLAILINVINGIRQRNMEKVLFGQGGLAGMLLYWGIVLIVLPFIGFGDAVLQPGVILPCLLLPLALVFLREPLSKLASRRKDWRPKEGVGGFLVSNFFELFEILLSFLTNTLSFLRVGAYAISHASMMTVVYSLAQTDTGHNIVVLIIGNIIVTGIEGLLVGIQVLRLEFYELFGKFYNGAGRPYQPMKIDYGTKKE